MNDFIIGLDKEANKVARSEYKYRNTPIFWALIGIQLKLFPTLMSMVGYEPERFLPFESIGLFFLTSLPLVLYLTFSFYRIPWGVISPAKDAVYYRKRVAGMIDSYTKGVIGYEIIERVRYDSKRCVLSIYIESETVEFVVEEETAQVIEGKITEKLDELRKEKEKRGRYGYEPYNV